MIFQYSLSSDLQVPVPHQDEVEPGHSPGVSSIVRVWSLQLPKGDYKLLRPRLEPEQRLCSAFPMFRGQSLPWTLLVRKERLLPVLIF